MKKIILIATTILIFLIFIFYLLTNKKPFNTPTSKNNPTPTPIQLDFEKRNQIIDNLIPYTPYENEDFYFDYLTEKNKFVLEKKTPLAKEKFQQWLIENRLDSFANNPELDVVIEYKDFNNNLVFEENPKNKNNFYKPKPTPTIPPPIDLGFFTIYYGQNPTKSTTNNKQSNDSSNKNNSSSNNNSKNNLNSSSKYLYYSQCNSPYENLSLPDGCNMCQAGCGAATASMIASSYLNNQYDPKFIVSKYGEKKYYLGCNGSSYYDAKSLLQSLGLKTTDFIYFDLQPADKIISDLKKYYNAGWTFFALANFRKDGGGHFFWITEIDNNGNIWAYDPYYGRFQAPPINENSRYPFPLYRVAFGVKK